MKSMDGSPAYHRPEGRSPKTTFPTHFLEKILAWQLHIPGLCAKCKNPFLQLSTPLLTCHERLSCRGTDLELKSALLRLLELSAVKFPKDRPVN